MKDLGSSKQKWCSLGIRPVRPSRRMSLLPLSFIYRRQILGLVDLFGRFRSIDQLGWYWFVSSIYSPHGQRARADYQYLPTIQTRSQSSELAQNRHSTRQRQTPTIIRMVVSNLGANHLYLQVSLTSPILNIC